MQKESRQPELIEVTALSRGVVPGWRGAATYVVIYRRVVQDVAGETLTCDLGVGRVHISHFSIWERSKERRCLCARLK